MTLMSMSFSFTWNRSVSIPMRPKIKLISLLSRIVDQGIKDISFFALLNNLKTLDLQWRQGILEE